MPDNAKGGTIRLVHPDAPEGEVVLHLPMPMDLAGETLQALGRLGYDLPAAAGARTMTVVSTDDRTITVNLEAERDGTR